jgi:hypothetical protein
MNADLITRPNLIKNRTVQPVSPHASVLTDIYQSQHNIAIWQRSHSIEMSRAIHYMLQNSKPLSLVKRVTADNVAEYIRDKTLGYACSNALSEDIALIVDMFCCLFDVQEVGLRLTTLDSAMCPKFHIDKIPCRLVTTYAGSATQWLENSDIDRNQLVRSNAKVADHLSSLFKGDFAIKQMLAGDVALLKGSGWKGNEERGLVHRSPALMGDERRLLLTLDLV